MGAFGADLISNDNAMDAEAEIKEICGLDVDGELTADLLNTHMDKIQAVFDDPTVNNQDILMLGWLILNYGATLPQTVKLWLFEAYKEEIDRLNHWVQPTERAFYLNDFLEKVSEYDGQPVKFAKDEDYQKLSQVGVIKLTPQQKLMKCFAEIGVCFVVGENREGVAIVAPVGPQEFGKSFDSDRHLVQFGFDDRGDLIGHSQ